MHVIFSNISHTLISDIHGDIEMEETIFQVNAKHFQELCLDFPNEIVNIHDFSAKIIK